MSALTTPDTFTTTFRGKPDPSDELLEALRNDPEWKLDALCLEYAVAIGRFPERGQPSEPAKAVCARCLVQAECLDFALRVHEPHGIWGGLTEAERRRLLPDA